jgi:hypothetical protein
MTMNANTEESNDAVAGQVEESVSQRRLYAVRVVREAYVLAETQEEAETLVREIERWEEPVIEVDSGSVDLGWPGDCYVYHTGKGDITLAQARLDFAAA